MKSKDKSLLWILCAVFLLLVVVISGVVLWVGSRDRVKAKKTLARMNDLVALIEYDRNRIRSTEDVWRIADEYGWTEVREDAWGNPLIIELSEKSEGVYIIRSPGKDGVLGECCRGQTGKDWSADAVVEVPEKWLQYWET